MSPFAVLVDFRVDSSCVGRFRDLISANAQASLENETRCTRFDAHFDSSEPRRFVLYQVYDDEAAFDERLASSHHLSFAAAIENKIEQRSIRRLAYCREAASAGIVKR